MSRYRKIFAFPLLVLVFGLFAASNFGQSERPSPDEIKRVKLPLELLAIGDMEAAKNWRFGRIESVVQEGPGDVIIKMRLEDGRVIETVGSRRLSDLARASNWVPNANKSQLSRADYVERMVAFDLDQNNRIIAMISMEPIDRDRSRLQRGL